MAMPLSPNPLTTDIRGQLVFLGTGTSVGVPIPGCGCATCRSHDKRNHRTRCGLAIGLPGGNLLVDTPTDLRSQLLREQIAMVHAVLYTHDHADHLFGLDDLRVLSFYLGGKIPLYCESQVEERIRRSFDYAFSKDAETLHEGAIPQLHIVRITTAAFELLGARIIPVRLKHGKSDVLGFRFGNVAYCTDTNQIPDDSWPLLQGLDVLIIDALRYKGHPTHFSLDEAVSAAERLRPRRTLFTHMAHDLEHAATNAALPDGMELAFDGLKVALT